MAFSAVHSGKPRFPQQKTQRADHTMLECGSWHLHRKGSLSMTHHRLNPKKGVNICHLALESLIGLGE